MYHSFITSRLVDSHLEPEALRQLIYHLDSDCV